MAGREAGSEAGSEAGREAGSVAVSQLAFGRRCLDRPMRAFITVSHHVLCCTVTCCYATCYYVTSKTRDRVM